METDEFEIYWRTDGHGEWYGSTDLDKTNGLGIPLAEPFYSPNGPPRIVRDGDKWMALLGENLQVGIAGFGDDPEEALEEFIVNLRTSLSGEVIRCHRCNWPLPADDVGNPLYHTIDCREAYNKGELEHD